MFEYLMGWFVFLLERMLLHFVLFPTALTKFLTDDEAIYFILWWAESFYAKDFPAVSAAVEIIEECDDADDNLNPSMLLP